MVGLDVDTGVCGGEMGEEKKAKIGEVILIDFCLFVLSVVGRTFKCEICMNGKSDSYIKTHTQVGGLSLSLFENPYSTTKMVSKSA